MKTVYIWSCFFYSSLVEKTNCRILVVFQLFVLLFTTPIVKTSYQNYFIPQLILEILNFQESCHLTGREHFSQEKWAFFQFGLFSGKQNYKIFENLECSMFWAFFDQILGKRKFPKILGSVSFHMLKQSKFVQQIRQN